MQDVGCDGTVDVDIGKVFPENALDRLNSCISTCLGEFGSPFIDGIECFCDFLGVTRLKNAIPIADVVLWCRTDGTSASCNQRDEDLLWIIPYIGSENWEAPPHGTVSTDENDSITPSTLQWLDNGLHAMVKEVQYAAAM